MGNDTTYYYRRTGLTGVCVSESVRRICLNSAHLCIAAVPQVPLMSWTQVATSSEGTRKPTH